MVETLKKDTRTFRPTISQIAEIMKVSRSTVSRALNGSSEISETVKSQIQETARRLNYQPHIAAQNLARGKTMKLGVLVRNLYLEPNAVLVQAIEEAAGERGYRVSLEITGESEAKMASRLGNFLHGQADGLILLTTAVPNHLVTHLADQGHPVGIFGYRIPSYEHLLLMELDERAEFRQMLDYLYNLGHRNFGVLWQLKSGETSFVEELERFIREKNLSFSEENETNHIFNIEQAESAARSILTRNPRITAMVCLMDTIAVGTIHAATKMGLKVPDDLSVVGNSDLPIGRYFLPPVTTLRYPFTRIAQIAVKKMIDRIEGRPESPLERVCPELLVRKSTGPVKKI
jgi:LacI family transcriptional regulator